MSMTVITITNAPNSLRGDLTKWMQEIAVGVYIGNFNSKVREQLWIRVTQSVGNGNATMSYHSRNEIGYNFKTYKTHRQNIDFDGIPLVLIPVEENEVEKFSKRGFSQAAQFRKVKKLAKVTSRKVINKYDYVIVDIETDGLDENLNKIIEIGAVKVVSNTITKFERMIEYSGDLPEKIVKLTGISTEELHEKGKPIKEVLIELRQFIGELPIVGYSIEFDLRFINLNLKQLELPLIINSYFDLLRYIKKDKMFLRSYKLNDVLQEYDLSKTVIHRALSDAEVSYDLAMKVNGFLNLLDKK